MAKHTFTLRTKGGGEITDVPYTPLIFIAGSVAHRLALHKDPRHGHWLVSEPKCGAKICVVDGQYRGIRVSSKSMGLRDVRQLAVGTLEALVSNIGSDKFNAVLANPRPF